MPKHDPFSPKGLSNRMKAKGLQKLRWYCEMCQKQCRDENGFKCHQTSEGHLRQMRVFAENPGKFKHDFSAQFESNFLTTLSRLHNTKRVQANQVYKEYISDKEHLHMNATRWPTLTGFIMHLGRTGKCVVDETEKGWYIQWIDRNPEKLAKQEAAEKKRKHDLDDEARRHKEVKRRVKAAAADQGDNSSYEATALVRDEEEKVSIALASNAAPSKKPKITENGLSAFGESEPAEAPTPKTGGPSKTKKTAMEVLMEQEEKRKQMSMQAEAKTQRKDYWLHPGIVVKVMNKKLADGKFYKMKGVVRKVIEKYVGLVEMDESGAKIQIDQDDLETVIPKAGGFVRIVNGVGRGSLAEVRAINVEKFNVTVRVADGDRRGQTLEGIDYEDISKVE